MDFRKLYEDKLCENIELQNKFADYEIVFPLFIIMWNRENIKNNTMNFSISILTGASDILKSRLSMKDHLNRDVSRLY